MQNTFIDRDQYIEARQVCQFEQIAVAFARESRLWNGLAPMPDQLSLQATRHALIEENFH